MSIKEIWQKSDKISRDRDLEKWLIYGSYPGVWSLESNEEKLRELKVGYRAKMIMNLSQQFVNKEIDEFRLRKMSKERIKEKESMNNITENGRDTEKNCPIFRLSKPENEKIIKDLGGDAWFTHYFTVPSFDCTSFNILSKDGPVYKCEQYNDIFHLWYTQNYPDKRDTNAFWELTGYAQGFEIECIPSPSRTSFLRKLLLAVFISGTLISSFSPLFINHISTIQHGQNLNRFIEQEEIDTLLKQECGGVFKNEEVECKYIDPCGSTRKSMEKGELKPTEVCAPQEITTKFNLLKVNDLSLQTSPLFFSFLYPPKLFYGAGENKRQLILHTNSGAAKLINLLETYITNYTSKSSLILK